MVEWKVEVETGIGADSASVIVEVLEEVAFEEWFVALMTFYIFEEQPKTVFIHATIDGQACARYDRRCSDSEHIRVTVSSPLSQPR